MNERTALAGGSHQTGTTSRTLAPGADIPPQNLDAEESVLGAMMLSAGAIGAVSEALSATDFYRESHAKIYRAGLALYGRGDPVDGITLVDELERRGELADVGGKERICELAALVPAASNAGHYARIVREKSALREALRELTPVVSALSNGGADLAEVTAALDRAKTALATRADDGAAHHRGAVDGASFILGEPVDVPAIWGAREVLWAEGEALMIVGPDGVGKTTLLQQLALARLGVKGELLGEPVACSAGRVLYVAADRPRQAARSFRRMVADVDPGTLRDRLVVWRGPLPFDLTENPRGLAEFARGLDVSDVFIDSLKDVAVDLSKDETGSRVNRAFQELIADGLGVCVAHHPRKEQQGYVKPKTLADVYGSRWLTAGIGSVLLLWGDPGDLVVELSHLQAVADGRGNAGLLYV